MTNAIKETSGGLMLSELERDGDWYDQKFAATLRNWQGLEKAAREAELHAKSVTSVALAANDGKNEEARRAYALTQPHVRGAVRAADDARVDADSAFHLMMHLRGKAERVGGES